MRINLIYEELRILITTYKSISVDELCQNVKIFMNDKENIRYYTEEILKRGCGIDVFDKWNGG